jgi:hypothetical protein
MYLQATKVYVNVIDMQPYVDPTRNIIREYKIRSHDATEKIIMTALLLNTFPGNNQNVDLNAIQSSDPSFAAFYK